MNTSVCITNITFPEKVTSTSHSITAYCQAVFTVSKGECYTLLALNISYLNFICIGTHLLGQTVMHAVINTFTPSRGEKFLAWNVSGENTLVFIKIAGLCCGECFDTQHRENSILLLNKY